jgi:uncharacterized protein
LAETIRVGAVPAKNLRSVMENNIKIEPEFYRNEDNNHCLQASIMIVLNTLLEEKLSLEEVDNKTKYEDGKWTWGIAGVLAISSKVGNTKLLTNNLDYNIFVSRGAEYLKETWGEDYYDSQKNYSSNNFIKEQELAKSVLERKLWESKNIDQSLIDQLLDSNMLISFIDPECLRSGIKSNYRHWVVLFDKNNIEFILHDPGMPPCKGMLVNKENFFKAFRGDLILVPKGSKNIGHIPKVGRNDLCQCGSGKKFKKCHGNKFEVKESQIEGKGAFAIVPIKKSELICFMDGEEISVSELDERYKKGQERLSDPLQVDGKMYIDLFEPYVLINHSCDPNAVIIERNELIALRDIEIGEEITYDYSLTEWSDNDSWQDYGEWFMECKCGSPLCRKKIGEFYLLPEDLKVKYIELGYVRDFIMEKFKKYHGK